MTKSVEIDDIKSHTSVYIAELKDEAEIERHNQEMNLYKSAYITSTIGLSNSKNVTKSKKDAIKAQRTFGMLGGRCEVIESSLRKRRWVEELCYPDGSLKQNLKNGLLPGNNSWNGIDVKFLWCQGYLVWHHVRHSTIINKFPDTNSYLTTKVGLSKSLQNLHWVHADEFSEVHYPRTFIIHELEDLINFSNDYRITACISILSYFVEKNFRLVREFGKVSFDIVDFAIKRVCEYINFREHADIDIVGESSVDEDLWKNFLEAYYCLVHKDGKFKRDPSYNIQLLINSCKRCLEFLRYYWPDMNIDGYRNVWIIKPGASSQGRGIQTMRDLETILDHCASRKNFVIQKYIEKPFLIHNTKFDIRQWFLVTSLYPLEIWMYDKCYLRFSSQEFTLDHFHESIHLCNNSVQFKYKNAERNEALPEENMWDSDEFKCFLEKRGLLEKWMSKSIPKMKKTIVGALLCAQEEMGHRSNSFALYGADFMLTEDLVPWLIEINSTPAMGPSTKVTARMCTDVLEDVIKVIIDRKENPAADTGGFRLIYNQNPLMLFNFPLSPNESSFILTGEKIHFKKKTEMVREEKQLEKSIEWRSIKYEEMANYRKCPSLKTAPANEESHFKFFISSGSNGMIPNS